MTDIVGRLRGFADTEMPVEALAVVCEAADEIERLRGALNRSVKSELRMERASGRLYAALESLTEDPPPTLDEPDTDAEVVIKMRAIARAALNIHKRGET